MPRLACWFIRTALCYLQLGFTLGGLLLWNKGFPLYPQLWRLLPLHIEFLFFGWIVQLAMGVAFWILPRFYAKRRREHLAWLAFGLINLGCWLVVVGAWWQPTFNLLLVGRVVEVCAIVAFIAHAWQRIKPPMTD